MKDFFFEDNKILFSLNSSFIVGSLFNAEGSTHDSIDGVVRILGKGVDEGFTFEVDVFLDSEGIGEVTQNKLYSLFKVG